MEVSYKVQRSRRKSISIQVQGRQVLVRAPMFLSDRVIREFVKSKESWIEKQLRKQADPLPTFTEEERRQLAKDAAKILPPLVRDLAGQMGSSYGRVTLRFQKTRWGSCSAQGNLNFNCLLALAPEPVQRYVVIHELCHRKELNHSPAFWALVERAMPDYRVHKQWLKEEGSKLICRLPE